MIYNNRVIKLKVTFCFSIAQPYHATLLRIFSGVNGAHISSRTLIKGRIFINGKLIPSRNGYFLLDKYGDPHFLFHIFAENGVFME